MPLDLGPVQFQIVGTFMDKPRLLINGEEVPYERMYAEYMPEETVEYGPDDKETYPERIALGFSLSSRIGQLEANVNYRVKANAEGQFVLAKEEKKPWPPKKKESPKDKKDEEKMEEEGKKDKKCGTTVKFRLVQEEPLDRDPLRNEILKNLVREDD